MLELIPIARDAVIEGMQGAVFVLDLMDRVVDLNSSAQRLLAEPAEKPAGRPLSVVSPQLSAQVEQRRISGIDDLEVSIAGKTGTLHWRLRQSPIHSHADRLSGRLVILQDIIGQKAHEAAIRESEEKFRSHRPVLPAGGRHCSQHAGLFAQKRCRPFGSRSGRTA